MSQKLGLTSELEKMFKWALGRFKNRKKFIYPSFCRSLSCCKSNETTQRIRFAKLKLRKELDISRFINHQRETYISYLTNMPTHQQVMCQKLAQITFDDSLSSQNSSTDDNAQFVWNGTDKRNLALLF